MTPLPIFQSNWNNHLLVQHIPKPVKNKFKISQNSEKELDKNLPVILFISSYPPRECGIATYTQDLINSINNKFKNSFIIKVIALQNDDTELNYPEEVWFHINVHKKKQYHYLANKINTTPHIAFVYLQHEFGLFGKKYGKNLLKLTNILIKPFSITFHTVLDKPNSELKNLVQKICKNAFSVVVMTNSSLKILKEEYEICSDKIKIIAHGTHLVQFDCSENNVYPIHFADRIILSTFGLIGEGKSIETAIKAMAIIIKKFPNVLYLVIGKTHPEVIKVQGENYREYLYELIVKNELQNHVKFINRYLSLEELLEYLQKTKIYFFTSKDPNQAVSGTLAYAVGCGCPVISTPIPHAKEILHKCGVTFEYENHNDLAVKAISLLQNESKLKQMHYNAIQNITPSCWQNNALLYANIYKNYYNDVKHELKYQIPIISVKHIKRLTTPIGIVQFSKLHEPDESSGYTLDDNARALIAVIKYYELTLDKSILAYVSIYLRFIRNAQLADGSFLNYIDQEGNYMLNNMNENLEDSNGRAIWAIGEFLFRQSLFHEELNDMASEILKKSLNNIVKLESPRAISFAIKGLCICNISMQNNDIKNIIKTLTDKLVYRYKVTSKKNWKWFEGYLTYANSVIPEAMLMAYLSTNHHHYKKIAINSFEFLLKQTFYNHQIKVISNQGWKINGEVSKTFGEQPIEIAYTIIALATFNTYHPNKNYQEKINEAYNWFLGENHLNQIIYNPATGGCFDGLEETNVNLNQGAESTICYLMSRLIIEKQINHHLSPNQNKTYLVNT